MFDMFHDAAEFVANTVEKTAKSVVNTADSFVHDPVGTTVDIATRPIVDGCDLLDGLTEGEFRHRAALRLGLGGDDVASIATSELIDRVADLA
jgi:hypothetical protein